jgi:2'-5' RNA ligase
METYRLFIAAKLPPSVKTELAETQTRLRQANLPVIWVAPDAMHLTLRFLGETNVALLPNLERAMQVALARHSPMTLRLSGAGAFPNEHRPSVVWAGVSGEIAAFARVQADIEGEVTGLGFAPETRPFRAHLTLGRLRREANPAQQQQLGAAIRSLPAPAPLEWKVEHVGLFRSDLRNAGPVYTEIHTITLA